MPKNSSNQNKKPAFKSEAEEAGWLSSPVGRRYVSRRFQAAAKTGIVTTESRDFGEVKRLLKEGNGRLVRAKNGLDVKPTDPAILEKLYLEAVAKITKPVSIRMAVVQIERAKAVAAKRGVGYQTLLKEIIDAGLKEAS